MDCGLFIKSHPFFGDSLLFLSRAPFIFGAFGVGESVDEDLLFFGVKLVPSRRQVLLLFHFGLQLLQLLHVVVSNLEILFFRSNKLEGLVHRPGVLFHEVSDQDGRGPRFPIERVDEAALPLLQGLLNELVDCVDSVVFFIEDLKMGHCLHFAIFPSS